MREAGVCFRRSREILFETKARDVRKITLRADTQTGEKKQKYQMVRLCPRPR